jgi:hypothetical protein
MGHAGRNGKRGSQAGKPRGLQYIRFRTNFIADRKIDEA